MTITIVKQQKNNRKTTEKQLKISGKHVGLYRHFVTGHLYSMNLLTRCYIESYKDLELSDNSKTRITAENQRVSRFNPYKTYKTHKELDNSKTLQNVETQKDSVFNPYKRLWPVSPLFGHTY